jgi:valyl-tRNA synthetase
MKKTRDIVSQILSVRVEKSIPVRQVLSSAAVLKENDVSDEYKKLILEETNIKNIEVVNSLDEKTTWESDLTNSIKLNVEITEDLLKEGKAREFIRNVQDIRKEMGLQISDEILLTYKDSEDMKEVITLYGDEIKKKLLARDIIPGKEIKVEKL